MRYIGIIILLVLCLTLLLLTGCMINTVTPEIASGNLENEDTEEPVIEDTGETRTVYPQKWATGDGTAENPWANDCIEKAYDAVPAGGTIFLKRGHYTLSTNLELNKKINIVGEGRNKTIIKTVGNFGFIVIHDYCTLKGMTIDGDTHTDRKDLSCINIRDCDHITLEDIEAKNSFTGIQIFRVNRSSFKNIYVHDNYRHGLLLGSDTAGNTYKDIYAWNNGIEEDTVIPETANGDLENQEDINQSSNNSQSSSTEPVEEPATVEVDTTKPVITGSRTPLPNSFGWNNTDVTVSFSCEDAGPVQSGIETNTVAGATVTTEGKDQSVTNTGECIDAAGNIADPVTVSNINIDKTPPVVTLTLPGTGEYGLNESVTATWSATDALSGVVSLTSGTVSIDTSSVGTKTITLPAGKAMDKAGNSSLKVTKSYSVIADTEEPVTEEPEDPEMVYPQKWATGTGTAENPWANNCIVSAYTACPAGGTIFLKAGYYTLSTTLTIRKQINIIGEGRNKTFIILDITEGYGIFINETDYVTLKGFTIDGDSQIDGPENSCIRTTSSDYLTFEDIESKNSGMQGLCLYEMNYSSLKNIFAHDNGEHGIHPTSNISSQYNSYQNIYCWNNEEYGFSDYAAAGSVHKDTIYDNIHCWDNGFDGITIGADTLGDMINCSISNCSVSGNGERGMSFDNIQDFSINNCSIILSGLTGIRMYDSENVNFTNVIVKNNDGEDWGYYGIHIKDCNDITFTSCQSYDDRETPLQSYGLSLAGTNTGISLLNCQLSPNATGEIYNPAGAVVTVITEKMLAKF